MKPSRTFSQVKMEITAYSDFDGGEKARERKTQKGNGEGIVSL